MVTQNMGACQPDVGLQLSTPATLSPFHLGCTGNKGRRIVGWLRVVAGHEALRLQ
jgi:hypothetical protein